jgi:hypothetical protein
VRRVRLVLIDDFVARAGHVAGVPVLIPVAPRQLGPSFFRLASI